MPAAETRLSRSRAREAPTTTYFPDLQPRHKIGFPTRPVPNGAKSVSKAPKVHMWGSAFLPLVPGCPCPFPSLLIVGTPPCPRRFQLGDSLEGCIFEVTHSIGLMLSSPTPSHFPFPFVLSHSSPTLRLEGPTAPISSSSLDSWRAPSL